MIEEIKLIMQRDKSNVLNLNLKCNYIKALQGLTSRGSLTSGFTGGYSHSVIFMTDKPLTGLKSLTILAHGSDWPILLPIIRMAQNNYPYPSTLVNRNADVHKG